MLSGISSSLMVFFGEVELTIKYDQPKYGKGAGRSSVFTREVMLSGKISDGIFREVELKIDQPKQIFRLKKYWPFL